MPTDNIPAPSSLLPFSLRVLKHATCAAKKCTGAASDSLIHRQANSRLDKPQILSIRYVSQKEKIETGSGQDGMSTCNEAALGVFEKNDSGSLLITFRGEEETRNSCECARMADARHVMACTCTKAALAISESYDRGSLKVSSKASPLFLRVNCQCKHKQVRISIAERIDLLSQ